MPMITKPSSIFIYIDNNNAIFFDYLVESPDFKRSHTVHHKFLEQFDLASGNNKYHLANLLTRDSLWSGHAAALISPYKGLDYSYAVLLDRFSHPQCESNLDRYIANTLHANGMLPVTARGQIIDRTN